LLRVVIDGNAAEWENFAGFEAGVSVIYFEFVFPGNETGDYIGAVFVADVGLIATGLGFGVDGEVHACDSAARFDVVYSSGDGGTTRKGDVEGAIFFVGGEKEVFPGEGDVGKGTESEIDEVIVGNINGKGSVGIGLGDLMIGEFAIRIEQEIVDVEGLDRVFNILKGVDVESVFDVLRLVRFFGFVREEGISELFVGERLFFIALPLCFDGCARDGFSCVDVRDRAGDGSIVFVVIDFFWRLGGFVVVARARAGWYCIEFELWYFERGRGFEGDDGASRRVGFLGSEEIGECNKNEELEDGKPDEDDGGAKGCRFVSSCHVLPCPERHRGGGYSYITRVGLLAREIG
jgi:hypothetical protein